MCIELVKFLFQNNDVLLFDEFINYFDIEFILWLEEFLKNYIGVVMFVFYDRMFLDNIINRIIEILLGKIYDYNKLYIKYFVL